VLFSYGENKNILKEIKKRSKIENSISDLLELFI